MGFFSNILSKLGIGSAEAAQVDAPQADVAVASSVEPTAASIAVVDVVAQLENGHSGFLNGSLL